MNVEREELRFPGASGEEVRAVMLQGSAEEPGERSGVVLVHEVFGLDAYVLDVAEGLAAAGHAVIAPDLYSREGLPGPASTEAEPAPTWDSDQIRGAVASMPDRRAIADLEAAAALLIERFGVDDERLGALGFCMGGNYAYLLGCASRSVSAVVDFYGRIVYPELSANKPTQPLELALNLGAPFLGLFGAEDASIPAEHVQRLDGVLSQFAKDFAIFTYPGAGHGFHNHRRPAFHEDAASDAWNRALAFLDEHLRQH
ncbi:MAG: dienelactone hydrolase family protein [Planctomycetota bacterium]